MESKCEIFRIQSGFEPMKFAALFNCRPPCYSDSIVDLAIKLANIIKNIHRNCRDISIEFPQNIYKIDCLCTYRVEFFQSVPHAEINVFWDRFSKAMSKD